MWELLVQPMEFAFMQHALTAAIISSVVCALLSCWLVLMGWSLMGDAVAHSILPGIVLAHIFGLPMALGAFVFGMLAVLLIGGISGGSTLKHDTSIGVVFTSLFALGLVLVSRTPSETHLTHILFGNVLGISQQDLLQTAGLGLATVAVLLTLRRSFVLLAFDKVHAHTIGLSTGALSILLLALLALTTVTALQTLGILLVVAMLVVPGATALLLCRRFGPMLAVAASSAAASAVIGVYASYWLDISTGGSIVLAQSGQFALAYLFAPVKGMIPRLRQRRQRPPSEQARPTRSIDTLLDVKDPA
ncbi:metal ABC transporter permease [Nesterenkonia sp. LB17]|uniref:metal ABC transporter permease n=1 Tax=unclassified Nesterenkonia TaxID=2629769 RepID=UPI001F4C7E0A|nr:MULTISPECIES: metal ABC transporter permease [unclassified Nesterenkonia]MCH8559567.1 metal ABC transporter permease [Nesterenkonia sp. DZ6]MCH8561744.1 metal ABC transporter permease [Nesterenkonia sp. YGD6]MCH8564737.1 metal ABC transporter permease [Nesterenkonia sp. LB17]MCH8570357.1 metal ABC transporter permease [Nesterenkonia sp. AY15]